MKKTIIAGLVAFSVLSGQITPVLADKSDDLISEAKQHMGTPYVWGGTSTRGFDCSGFLQYVFKQNSISLPRTVAEMYKVGTSVSKSSLQVGDLVFFETYKPGASHAGIYLGNNSFIHSSSSKGVAINTLNDSYWKPRYIGAKRIIKEEVKQVVNKVPAPAPTPAPAKKVIQTGTFSDVSKSHWAYAAIEEYSKRNIINGYGNGEFKPNETITREQAAVIITAMMGVTSSTGSVPFHDISTNRWSAKAIAAAYKHGVFSGDSQGRFNPTAPLTRAQFASIMERIYDLPTVKVSSVATFNDVPENFWAHDAIETTHATGLFMGYDSNTFKPGEKTTRAQFVSVLKRSEKFQ